MINERQLIAMLDVSGFDFGSTAREIGERFPVELDWGVAGSTILPYRVTQPFAGFGPIWKVPVSREIDFDLPPTMYFHEFHPTNDVRSNFDQAVGQLTAVLGKGEKGGASNAFERTWRIDVFTLRAIAWPREKNTTFRNVFEGHNPYLWVDAKIYIQPDFPFVHLTEDASQPMREVLAPAPGCRVVCESAAYTRRNLAPAPRGTMTVGTTDEAFLVRAEDRSVRVPRAEIQQVVHTRLTPGRFSGSSSLALATMFLGRHQVRVTFAHGDRTESLDSAAAKVAGALATTVVVEQYSDDG